MVYIKRKLLNRKYLCVKSHVDTSADGWMLKAASESDRAAVFEFVMTHKMTMPRTALRYSIEKMPKELKTKAMER